MQIDHEAFLEIVLLEFPDLESDMKDEVFDGLLHPQMGLFSHRAQEAIDSGDEDCVSRCFEIAHRFLHDGDSCVVNAVCVSFLENLNFQDGKKKRVWALGRLSPLLMEELKRLNAGWNKAFGTDFKP